MSTWYLRNKSAFHATAKTEVPATSLQTRFQRAQIAIPVTKATFVSCHAPVTSMVRTVVKRVVASTEPPVTPWLVSVHVRLDGLEPGKGWEPSWCDWLVTLCDFIHFVVGHHKAWFTILIYAGDGCEAARLRANWSEKVLRKHAGVFTKFSCLRDFATRRADHQGVRPLVYRRIYNTQVYQYGRKQNGTGMQKERSHWFFVFSSVALFVILSFPLFLFSHFLQIAIAAKMIEQLRHMQYLDYKIRYEVVRAPSLWKLDYLKNKRAVFTRTTTKEVQKGRRWRIAKPIGLD